MIHPELDLFDEIVRMLGWPTLLGVIVWAIRTWDKGQRQWQEIDKNAKVTVDSIAIVKADVERIETNHLVHLQDGITQVAASNDKAVEILHTINSGIQVLVDRTPRA